MILYEVMHGFIKMYILQKKVKYQKSCMQNSISAVQNSLFGKVI